MGGAHAFQHARRKRYIGISGEKYSNQSNCIVRAVPEFMEFGAAFTEWRWL